MTLKNHITIIYFVLFSIITLRASDDISLEAGTQNLPESVIQEQDVQIETTIKDSQFLQLHRRQCESKI